MTRLWAGYARNCGSFPGSGKRPLLESNQTGSGFDLISFSVGIKGSFPGVEGLGFDADHSSLSSVEAKNEWHFTACLPCFHGVQNDLTLTL